MSGISKVNLNRLQRIQNTLARVVCRANRRSISVDLLKSLHWLPISQRIEYKIALTVFKTCVGLSPHYLSSLLSAYQPQRVLRSAGDNLLVIPVTRTVTAGRAFRSYGPAVWNKLPSDLRALTNCNSECVVSTVDYFKKRLKTVLFAAAFGA